MSHAPAVPGPWRDLSRANALAWVGAFYVFAVLAAAVTVELVPGQPVWRAWWGDVAGTVVIFLGSLWLRNSSLYDPYWSVAPPVIAVWWIAETSHTSDPRAWLVLGLVFWWAVRLTANWARGWGGFGEEDWRYANIREKTGKLYWPVSFLGIHLFPTVQVFLGMLPVWALLQGDRGLNWIDGVAFVVTAGAILIETIADRQLHDWIAHRFQPGVTLREGIWGRCRHPNYLGEMGFWAGLALFALASGHAPWWAWSGAVAIIVMFNVVSIPMKERRMAERRADFDDYRRQVPRLFPRFRSP